MLFSLAENESGILHAEDDGYQSEKSGILLSMNQISSPVEMPQPTTKILFSWTSISKQPKFTLACETGSMNPDNVFCKFGLLHCVPSHAVKKIWFCALVSSKVSSPSLPIIRLSCGHPPADKSLSNDFLSVQVSPRSLEY